MDDKDRTIRIQQNMLELYEKEKSKNVDSNSAFDAKTTETANSATQTDRVKMKVKKILRGKINELFLAKLFTGATDFNGSGQFHEVITTS